MILQWNVNSLVFASQVMISLNTIVKPQLSRLIGTRQNSPDNREYEY